MRFFHFFLSVLLLCFLSACTTFGNSERAAQKGTAVTNKPVVQRGKEPVNFYYDFDDVLVPKEMELEPEKSLMFETPHVKAGLLSFTGRVKPVSLFNFFRVNMPKDGWQMRSYFKYGRYIIVFEKPEKDCILSIVEGRMNSNLEIWITPRISNVMRPEM